MEGGGRWQSECEGRHRGWKLWRRLEERGRWGLGWRKVVGGFAIGWGCWWRNEMVVTVEGKCWFTIIYTHSFSPFSSLTHVRFLSFLSSFFSLSLMHSSPNFIIHLSPTSPPLSLSLNASLLSLFSLNIFLHLLPFSLTSSLTPLLSPPPLTPFSLSISFSPGLSPVFIESR